MASPAHHSRRRAGSMLRAESENSLNSTVLTFDSIGTFLHPVCNQGLLLKALLQVFYHKCSSNCIPTQARLFLPGGQILDSDTILIRCPHSIKLLALLPRHQRAPFVTEVTCRRSMTSCASSASSQSKSWNSYLNCSPSRIGSRFRMVVPSRIRCSEWQCSFPRQHVGVYTMYIVFELSCRMRLVS